MTWQALNLAAVEFESEPKAPDIGGLLYSGLRHGLSGPPESVKTLVAWILSRELIGAGNRVAVVDFEMGPYATRRLLLDLGFSLHEIREYVLYFDWPGGEPGTTDIAAFREEGVTFVVIDAAAGAYDVSNLDDNKRQDVERFARAWVRPLFNAGITSVLIDHVTKNSETRGKYMIGSERKLGGLDVHLGLELVGHPLTRGGSAVVRFRVHKDRAGHLNRPVAMELHLHSDPMTHRITWDWKTRAPEAGATGEWRPTIYMERVSRSLEGRAPQSRTATYPDVPGQRARVIEATNFLLADGYLDEVEGRLVSTRPFRQPVPDGSRVVPDAEGNQSTDGSPVPKPFPAFPGTRSAGGSHGTPAYRREPGTGNGANAYYLLPGDPGFLHDLSIAKTNGHVTDSEWRESLLLHKKLARTNA